MPQAPFNLHVVSLPMTAAFTNAQASMQERNVVLVESLDGRGWGEAAPVSGQDESISDLIAQAKAGLATPTLAAGVDEALADAEARTSGVELERFGDVVPVCLAVGLDDPIRTVAKAMERGINQFKLKVAAGRTAHVAQVKGRYPDAVVGIDGNGSFGANDWDLDDISGLGLAFAEELYTDMSGPAADEFTSRTGVTMFADESIRSADDAREFLARSATGGITIKPGRIGWTGARSVRDEYVAQGRAFRFSGLLETSIGRAYTNRLAGDPRATVSDVAPSSWFFDDLVGTSYDLGGAVAIPTGPGIGINPDPGLLERYRTDLIEVELNLPAGRDRG